MRSFYLRIILIVTFSFYIFPWSVRAFSLECPEVATQGEDIVCKVQDQEKIGWKAKYVLDSVFTYLDFKVNVPWKGYYVGGKGFSIGNIEDKTELQGELSFRIGMEAISGQEYSIQLTEIEGVNEEGENVSIEDVKDTVRIVSDVNTLSKLEIRDGTLSPKFSSDVTSYQVSTKAEKIDIHAVLTDSRAKLEGDIGTKELKYGVNSFGIRVTSERGNVKEYKIFVTRVLKNQDATLKTLILNGKEVELEQDKYYYTLSVENDVHDLEIEAAVRDEFAKIEIEKPEELVIGENVVSIKVIAEDGTECIYVIHVFRKKELSNDNGIKDLVIKGYTLDFSSDKQDYELTIGNEKKLGIEVVLRNEFASYVIRGNKNLKNNSKIEIVVKAENGEERVYTIVILKEVESNSNSIMNSIRLLPLIAFILLVILVLIIKRFRNRVIRDE